MAEGTKRHESIDEVAVSQPASEEHVPVNDRSEIQLREMKALLGRLEGQSEVPPYFLDLFEALGQLYETESKITAIEHEGSELVEALGPKSIYRPPELLDLLELRRSILSTMISRLFKETETKKR